MGLSKFCLLILGIIALLIVPLSGCSIVQSAFQNPRYLYKNGAVLVGGDNEPIVLINSSEAVDVTYAQLSDFIRQDMTDQLHYIGREESSGLNSFVCSDFAEVLHNNAEMAGIRAGYTSIDWEEGGPGHAVNVFETTDEGVVYIDCTGPGILKQVDVSARHISEINWDKVAYFEIGKRFGVLSLDKAKSTSYEYYLAYEQKWDDYKSRLAAYNSKVMRYNQDIDIKIIRAGSKEAREYETLAIQLKAEEKELDAIGSEIGTTGFEPSGIVKSISMFW